MRILLLHNPCGPAADLLGCLNEHQFEIKSTTEEKKFLAHLAQDSNSGFDAVMVDLQEDGDNRLNLLAQLRAEEEHVPVLGFNPKGSEQQLLTALEKGCDDYLGKDFSSQEMVARLKALVRRGGALKKTTTLSAGDISIDLLKREVRRAGKLVDLQPREFSMLEFMLRNPGQPLTKLMIMQRVWNYNFDPQTNIVDVLICRLRSKIEEGFSTPVIQTVRGVGYLFTPCEKE